MICCETQPCAYLKAIDEQAAEIEWLRASLEAAEDTIAALKAMDEPGGCSLEELKGEIGLNQQNAEKEG